LLKLKIWWKFSSRHHYTAKVKQGASFKWPMFFSVS